MKTLQDILNTLANEEQQIVAKYSELRELAKSIFTAVEYGDDVSTLLEHACDLEYELLGDCETFGRLTDELETPVALHT